MNLQICTFKSFLLCTFKSFLSVFDKRRSHGGHASIPQLGAHFKLTEQQPSPILLQHTIARQKQINLAFQLMGHILDVQKTSLLVIYQSASDVVYQSASDVDEQLICHCA
jgi:hypothetical protein